MVGYGSIALALVLAACVENPTSSPTISATTDANKSLSFTMKKWIGPDSDPSSQKRAVNGIFKDFSVYLSKKVANLKKPADLNGLMAKVEVPLAASNLDTGDETRNTNISSVYFEVAKYATASFSLSNFKTTSTKDSFATGDTIPVTADAELDLHGIKKALPGLTLNVVAVDGGYQVKTAQDLSLKSDDFQLPWQALLQTCEHKGMDEAATVSFDVTLKN